MKLTPSSTARRSTRLAASRSGGGPQIPSPVMRIAPKPSRFTSTSPPRETVPAAAASLSFTGERSAFARLVRKREPHVSAGDRDEGPALRFAAVKRRQHHVGDRDEVELAAVQV